MTPAQSETAGLRAELARVRMERDIAKKPQRTLHKMCCKVCCDPVDEGALAEDADVRGTGGQRQRVL